MKHGTLQIPPIGAARIDETVVRQQPAAVVLTGHPS
jgi:hypothetical protein